MFRQILSFGGAIGTSIISEQVLRKLDAFKDKKAIDRFIQHLQDWEINFEKTHDGSIIFRGVFYSHFANFRVLEKTVEYVLGANIGLITEGKFIDEVLSMLTESIEQDTGNKLSVTDATVLKDFMHGLLASTSNFLLDKVSLEDRGILYLACQNRSEIKSISDDIKERFHLQESQIKSLTEKIDSILRSIETEDTIKEKSFLGTLVKYVI